MPWAGERSISGFRRSQQEDTLGAAFLSSCQAQVSAVDSYCRRLLAALDFEPQRDNVEARDRFDLSGKVAIVTGGNG